MRYTPTPTLSDPIERSQYETGRGQPDLTVAFGRALGRAGWSARKGERVRLISARTGFNSSIVGAMLEELRDALIFFAQSGRGVVLDGLGSFLPYIRLDGTIVISHRTAPAILSTLNAEYGFVREIANRENIGKTPADLIALWNTAHPEDPIPIK